MVSEFKNDILKLVKNFDVQHEPLLNFDDVLKECLDKHIKDETHWNKIAVACRRMIICDREDDLGRGNELIKETRNLFEEKKKPLLEKPFEAFEAIRYANTCGLILYRSGNYLGALNNFNEARELAKKYDLQYFIPDTTSNFIRADFEFFAHPLPKKFTEDHIIKLEQKCLEYIEKYDCEIKKSEIMKPDPDNEDERLKLIYGHGMASLHHNLGEAYSKAFTIRKQFDDDKVGYSQLRTKDIIKLEDFINELCRNDPLSRYLMNSFSKEIEQKISSYKPDEITKDDAESLIKALIDELNTILKEQSLFKKVENLSEIAQKLIKDNPQGHELIRLNRLILEDSYSQINRRVLNRLNLLEESKKQHEASLTNGNDIGDVYRQLQSKNALSKLANVDNEMKKKYENDVLDGNWKRGKQFIYQLRIRNSYLFSWEKIPGNDNRRLIEFLMHNFSIEWVKAAKIKKNDDGKTIMINSEINFLSLTLNDDKTKVNLKIDDGRADQFNVKTENGKLNIYKDINEWICKDDFKLDITDSDKFVLLYNLDSIKDFLKNTKVECVKIKGDKELNILKIAEMKIQIAEDIRSVYSPILYKRQVVNFIRDDVSLIIDDFLKHKKYPEAINFSEKHNNRSINDLINSEIKDVSQKQKDEIVKCKMEILKILNSKKHDGNKKDCKAVLSTKMSSILSDDTDKYYLKLIFAYEDILKKPANNGNKDGINNEDLYGILIDRLKKIPENENTAIIKFFIHANPMNTSKIYAFCIERGGITTIEVNPEFITDIQDDIKDIKEGTGIFKHENLCKKMSIEGKKIHSFIEAKEIRNLFIIPDGELFQVPLHLLSKDGQDLRKEIDVYYSPSLTQLLISNKKESNNNNLKSNYLWVRSPTDDLYTVNNEPCLKKPIVNEIRTLECMKATMDSFYENYEKENYTHVGFSTHCEFHNNLVTAYVSFIRFHDSFLTTYDILMLDPYYFNHIKTIFIGACSGGSSKFTDENEAVGLVTAFLAKKAYSIIAPIYNISGEQHNHFMDLLNESKGLNSSNVWNLSSILKNLESNDRESPGYLLPFVQYANLELVEKYITQLNNI